MDKAKALEVLMQALNLLAQSKQALFSYQEIVVLGQALEALKKDEKPAE